MQTTHYQALESKHAHLERKILSESQRPAPNQGLIAELKRRKLRLKEELAGL